MALSYSCLIPRIRFALILHCSISVAINWYGLEPVQDDFHYDFTGMADVTDGSGRASD